MKLIHSSYSHSQLEIKGCWHMQGPQPIGENGVPKWVGEIFKENSDIEAIAINKKKSGIVYSKLEEK